MKRNHLLVVMALFAITTLFSCSSEDAVINNGTNPITGPSLSFTIGVPKGEPETYAVPDPIQDAAESRIVSLYLYEFNSEKKLLAAPVDIMPDVKNCENGYTYTRELKTTDKSIRYFYLVANEAPSAQMTVGHTIDELKAILATKVLVDDASCNTLLNDNNFLMTGVAVKNNSEMIPMTNDGKPLIVALTRVLARLDIKNNMAGLVITDVKLANTNSKSYLFPHQNEGQVEVPSNKLGKVDKVSNILSYSSIPSSFVKEEEMLKAYYLYEGSADSEENSVHVEITGTLAGNPVFYTIPFWKDNQAISVQRNHLYHLELGDGTETIPDTDAKVSFTLKDSPWIEENNIQVFEIIASSFTPAEGTSYDVAKHELTVNNAGNSNLCFDFTTQFSAHNHFIATVLGTPAPTWVSTSVSGDHVTINVSPNSAPDAQPREANIQVSSDVDTTTVYTILVKQSN